MKDTRILDSSCGRFIFFRETPISYCKLIRDSIVGQIRNPTNSMKIRNSADATKYIRGIDGPISDTLFSFYPSSGRR